MALMACPECGKEVSDQALICPHCGYSARFAAKFYEYKSETTVFGLPLIHVIMGQGQPGRPKVARGIIAVGPIAVGVLAVGGTAFGGIALGGLAVGLVALGGAAFGLGLAAGGPRGRRRSLGRRGYRLLRPGRRRLGRPCLWRQRREPGGP